MLAYRSCIKVFATATSLHTRTLTVSKDAEAQSQISGFVIAPSKPEQLYVSLYSGLIELWDWKEGKKLGGWRLEWRISKLTAATIQLNNSSMDVVFTVDSLDSEHMITAHYLQKGQSEELQGLYRSEEPITSLQVLHGGRCIVASLHKTLIVGAHDGPIPGVKGMRHIWYEVPTTPITTFDGRPSVQRASQQTKSPLDGLDVDIAVGTDSGQLLICYNILQQMPVAISPSVRIAPKWIKLHWHRNPVGAAKWSLDGNYVLSGGSETVLVLWQLDTGSKQFLPHLGAAIEAMSVSHDGVSYAIRLADNSAMVVSTSELQPITYVPGMLLGYPVPASSAAYDSDARHSLTGHLPANRRLAITASKKAPWNLLMAVPAALPSQQGASVSSSTSWLQTVDPLSATQVEKQALARTKITDRNTGPHGNAVEDPNVVLLATSYDGRWLATVEEWCPPYEDVAHLSWSMASTTQKRLRAIEIDLKFWSWQEDDHYWELVSRVEKPHLGSMSASDPVGFVMDLVADRTRIGFVTVGNDGTAKLWHPKTRTRGLQIVKGPDAAPLTSWHCVSTLSIDPYQGDDPQHNTVRAALSADGSLMAVGTSRTATPTEPSSASHVHLANMHQHRLFQSRADFFEGPLANLGLVGRHLVILSAQLLVWDLISDSIVWALDLNAAPLLLSNPRAWHLAVDPQRNSFAVVIPNLQEKPETEKKRKPRAARVIVFEVNGAKVEPAFLATLPRNIRTLVPVDGKSSFYALDADAELHRVRAEWAAPELLPVVDRTRPEPAIKGLEKMYGQVTIRAQADEEEGDRGREDGDEHTAAESGGLTFVTQDMLRGIWAHYDPARLPPIDQLFTEVAKLVSGKRVSSK